MSQRIGLRTLFVGDYDEAIAYYTDLPRCVLGRGDPLKHQRNIILFLDQLDRVPVERRLEFLARPFAEPGHALFLPVVHLLVHA
jgi:hypothetical protein